MQADEPPSQLIKGRRERERLCFVWGRTRGPWSFGDHNPFTGVASTSSDPFRTGDLEGPRKLRGSPASLALLGLH